MPYYGLLDGNGNEIHGGGYHRLDAANAHFKISPPSVRVIDHLTFVNVESIQWPPVEPGGDWHAHSIALFDEVDSKSPMSSVPLKYPSNVRAGDVLIISPGSMRIGWRWGRDDEPEPEPSPKPASKVTEQLTRLRKENEMLRAENAELKDQLRKIRSA